MMDHLTNSIWNELHNDLKRYVCSKMNHDDNCHDILQEVFIRFSTKVDFTSVENIRPYIIRIASNVIADHYRKSKKNVPLESDVAIADNEIREQSGYLTNEFITRIIRELPEPYREAIIKTDLEGITQKDFAEMKGISVSGAKSRVQRARMKLKESILACCAYGFDKYGNVVSCCGEDIQGNPRS